MGFALVAKCAAGGFAGAVTANYGTLSGGTGVTATEAQAQNKARVAGTFSNLTAYMNNVGTGRVVRFRKNTANGNQVVNGTDVTAGVYTDAVNTDAVVATDLFDLSLIEGAGATTYYWFASLFKATSGHAVYYVAASSGGISFAAASFSYISGALATFSSEANAKATTRVGGTIQNFQLYISVNSEGSGTVTWTTRINGVNGTCSIGVAFGLTGFFEDTTHTDAYNSGDTINYANTNINNGITVHFIGCAVVSATSPINDVFSSGLKSQGFTATPRYFPFLGSTGSTPTPTTEDNKTAIRHQFACKTSKMRIFISANTFSTNGTMQFRKNLNTNGAQVLTITNGVTGLFEDTTNTDTLAAGDDIAFSIAGGTSGSIDISWAGLLEQDMTVVAAGTAPLRTLMGTGI